MERPEMSQTKPLDIQDFLNQSRFSPYQWMIFGLCFCVVLLDGFDTAAIGYIAPSLLKEWGIARPALGPVLSAALFGLAAGALSAGPLADRFGRRLVLTGSTLIFAVSSLSSAFAGTLDHLTVLRFVTGIGLGAAMPNAVTLISEYCPDNRRAMLTNAMFAGFPLGAALGGFLAAWMIPHWGWRSVLGLGGVAPLLLVAVMAAKLPESLRYMVARSHPAEAIRKALSHISQTAAQATAFVLAEAAPKAAGKGGVATVLSRSYLVGSVMMWLAYFMGLVIFYGLINWMPLLLKDAGVAPQSATLISALFPLGGVGAIFLGWLMDRGNGNLVVAAGYALTALFIFAIGQAVGNMAALVVLVLVAGTLMNTAQSSMPALAAGFYPTSGRATGVAWMLGMGRFGGIAGSTLVAELSRRQMSFGEMFAVMAVPGAIAALGLLIKQFAHPETAAEHDVAKGEAHDHVQEAQLGGH
jgi:MFS transporter, AAHS family, 4-hydroxybenzoate transporter